MKHCARCDTDKDEADFYKDRSKKSGIGSWCRTCYQERSKAQYDADPEAARERARMYAQTPLAQARRREVRVRLKREVIAAYGGECACCGEQTYEFLTVDHVGGWGAEHRRVVGEGTGNIYRWLKNNGFPQGIFRILCWNCNCAMGVHGYCPHGVVISGGLE